MSYSLNSFYAVLGATKQGVDQSLRRQLAFDQELEVLVKEADILKKEHPGCGVEKMYYSLMPEKMGRDKFCEIFISLGYGVKRIRRYPRTTIAGHISYPNLIEGLIVNRPAHLIQSDISYFDLDGTFYYLVFIVDVYTREIIGDQVSDHQRTEANMMAMNQALEKVEITEGGLIHHSDRGSQYGSRAYRKLLTDNGVLISMGISATENAYAERVNGIIKNEYLYRWKIKDFKDLKKKVKQAVKHYNNVRLHRGHGLKFSPVDFRRNWLTLEPRNRPTAIIYTEGKPNLMRSSRPHEIYPETEPWAHICPMD